MGKVTFSWEAMPEAVRYQLQFTLPSGKMVSFDTPNTSSTRYIESFLASGVYTWQVVALDGNGQVLCIAAPFTFTKPASVLPTQEKGGDGDSSDGTGGPGVGGGPGSGGPGVGGTDGSDGGG
jgi:hypothetical protein